MRTIVINKTNIIQDGTNSRMVYKFPNSVLFKNNSIAVSSISMYYSWFNISSALGNNVLTYTWTVGALTNTYIITIPDGLYEIDQLNAYFQFVMINNGHYLVDSTGLNVYYIELIVNPSRYAIQLNTFLVPTALPVGFVQPGIFAGYPTTTQNPVVTIPANFSSIIGFASGFASNANVGNTYAPPVSAYESKLANGTLSNLSTVSPNVQPNSSVYLSLSNINNPYSQPSSIIYAMVPNAVPGALIADRPPNYSWNKLIDGTYNELRLSFLGTDLQPLKINDPQITVLLVIKDSDELGLK